MTRTTIFIVITLVSAIAEAQTLRTYIDEAIANNTEIQAFELRYEVAQEKVNEVDFLPNTVFGAGYFVSEPETRTGAQVARFSVSQMVPWFGAITARENYMDAMAETDFMETVIAKRKLALNVAQTYYALYAIDAKQQIIRQNIALLKTYEQLALTSVEVGQASAVDVLRLQIRQNELQQQMAVLQEEHDAERAKFNQLLSREDLYALVTTEALSIPEADPELSKEGLQLNPELVKYDKLYASVAQSELVNQKESAPMLGFGLDYIPVQKRPDMAFNDNGKDIVMPMLSLSIPLFNNKFSSVTKQNQLQQLEIEALKQQRLTELDAALANAISQRNQARIKYSTQERNIEQANNAEQILLKSYETGTIDFNDVLDVQELQLKFQLNQIESVQMYYVQSAIINYLTNTL